MKRIKNSIVFLLIFIGLIPLNIFSMNGRQIMQKVSDIAKNHSDYISKSTMVLVNKRGHKRIRKLDVRKKNKKKNENKILLKVVEPKDIFGLKLLVWQHEIKDDDKWLYLPSSNITRRISSGDKDKPFLGSDFNFKDIGERKVGDYKQHLLGIENYKSREVYKVESIPKKPDVYSKIVTYVDKQLFIPLKTEFYNMKKDLFKIAYTLKFKKIGKQITIMKMKMENIKKKHMTYMITDHIKYNVGLKNYIFSKNRLTK